MTYKNYKYLIYSDLYRISSSVKLRTLVIHVIWGEYYKYNFWMRTCAFCKENKLLRYIFYPFAKIFFSHIKYKMGISIPFDTKIGSGLYIGHFGGIVVNRKSVIGKNCNISHNVTLGQSNRGNNKGVPVLGDNVYIGPGAKIIGAVRIGNNVAIGANCVVTKNAPNNSVIVGIPGKIISKKGSEGYITKTDYEDKIS